MFIFTKEAIKNDYQLAADQLLMEYALKNDSNGYLVARDKLREHYRAMLLNINVSPEYLDNN